MNILKNSLSERASIMTQHKDDKSDPVNVEWLVKPVLDDLDENALYKDSLIPVNIKSKWGYCNPLFDIVIAPQFDFALSFSEGLAAVRMGCKWGYINTTGDVVIDPQFDDIPGEFSEGLVRISRYDKDPDLNKTDDIFFIRSMFGYADRSGNIVIEPRYRQADNFSEGLASVGSDKKCGYIDINGNIVIDFIFDSASPFVNGQAVVYTGYKCGIIKHPRHTAVNLRDLKHYE